MKKILLSCMQGVGILIIVLGLYFFGLKNGYTEGSVRAMSFTALIVANIMVIITNRSWSRSIFSIIRSPNKVVKWIAGGAVIFLALVLNIPFFIKLFQFEALNFWEILISVTAGMITITWFEAYKIFSQRKLSPV
jgi:P-type Ca2+ transporter type 2C